MACMLDIEYVEDVLITYGIYIYSLFLSEITDNNYI